MFFPKNEAITHHLPSKAGKSCFATGGDGIFPAELGACNGTRDVGVPVDLEMILKHRESVGK